MLAKVLSAAGTALVANNTAGGKIFSGRDNGVERVVIDGDGTVVANAASGTALTGNGFTGVVGTSETYIGIDGTGGIIGVRRIGPTGVSAVATGNGTGLLASSPLGNGIQGTADSDAVGVYGISNGAFGTGTVGSGWIGISGASSSPTGIPGRFINLDATGKLIAAQAGFPSPVEVFTVMGNGNVGLGTTTPASLLSLHSDGNNTIRMTNQNVNHANSGTIDVLEGTGTFGTDAAGFRITYNGAGTNELRIQGAGGGAATTLMTFKQNSIGVGIGVTNPGRELEVNGGIQLSTVTAKPTCTNATNRGTFWVT